MQLICQLHIPAVLPSVKNAHYLLGSRLGRHRTSLVVLNKCQVCCPSRESNNDYSFSSIVGSRLTLPERQLKAAWLVRGRPALYITRRFIAAYTTDRHLSHCSPRTEVILHSPGAFLVFFHASAASIFVECR